MSSKGSQQLEVFHSHFENSSAGAAFGIISVCKTRQMAFCETNSRYRNFKPPICITRNISPDPQPVKCSQMQRLFDERHPTRQIRSYSSAQNATNPSI